MVAGTLTLICAAVAPRLRLDPAMIAFLPQEAREVRDFRRIISSLGTIDHHIVVVKVPGGVTAEDLAAVDQIGRRFESLSTVAGVEYRAPDLQQLSEQLLPRITLLLRPDELQRFREMLSDDAIRERMRQNRLLLETPQSGAMKQLVALDPLRLHSLFQSRVENLLGGSIDFSSGYFMTADRSAFLLIVTPKRPAQELAFARELMTQSRAIENDVLSQAATRPEILYAGGYAINVEDAELIRRDMIGNVLFSCIGVLLLFLVAFRRWIAVVYAAVPLIAGIVATFGLAAVTVRELTAASAGFAALLAGLGIDFITVLYERYIDERAAGLDRTAAITRMVMTTMPGVVIAATTTAATFYAFVSTDFRGMKQMGFLTGTGILLFAAAVAFILPSLLAWLEPEIEHTPRAPLRSFGASRLVRVSMQHPKITVAIWIALVAVSAVLARGLEFNDDASAIRPEGNRGVAAQEFVASRLGRSFDAVMLVAEGFSPDEVMRRSEGLLPRLEELVDRRIIGGYRSLSALLPSETQQRQVLGRLAELDGARIGDSIRAAARENGFRPAVFEQYIGRLQEALSLRAPATIPEISARFLRSTPEGWMAVTYLYPRERWGRSIAPDLRALEGKGLTLTGVNVVSSALRTTARRDALRATIAGTIIVFAALAIGFRSVSRAGLLFVPFLAGGVCMFGVMAALKLDFNFINIFVGLMLIGVGTDYGVYMLQRFLEDRHGFVESAPRTAKAVTMAALTTIVGYGSFAFSHYPGLQSLGYASTLGVGFSALAAITLLPAMLRLGLRR